MIRNYTHTKIYIVIIENYSWDVPYFIDSIWFSKRKCLKRVETLKQEIVNDGYDEDDVIWNVKYICK